MSNKIASKLLSLADVIYAFKEGEALELTPEQQKKLEQTTKSFKEYGEKLIADTKGKVLEFLKKTAEAEQLEAELKEFYAGHTEVVEGKKVKIDGWKKTSGYDAFKNEAIQTLQETMQVGQKLVFVSEVLDAKKDVSQRASQGEQLKILLSLSNADTIAIWEKEVEKMVRCNTEIKGAITAMGIKFVDYTDEAKEIAKKREVELKTSSKNIQALSVSDMFNKMIGGIKKLFDKTMGLMGKQRDSNKKLSDKLDDMINSLT